LLTPTGHKSVELFQRDDELLSRSEFDPEGPLEVKRVEEVFVRTGRIWHLTAGGQLIRTTPEHPFWVVGKGWVETSRLQIGDVLGSHNGKSVAVEALEDTGDYETVYNLRVADWHTYFVGGIDWGFSVWAHNAYSQADLNKQKGKVKWVRERSSMSDQAASYQAGAKNARNGKAPSLLYENANGKVRGVRFDGVDYQDKVMIDRKLSVVTTDKAKNAALRQSLALEQNAYNGRWEVGSQAQANRANRMFAELGITNITATVVTP